MTCPVCADRGIVKVNWLDADEDYAVCLCPAGERMRATTNAGKPCNPGWAVWAAQRGISLSRVVMLEDVLSADELAAKGFRELMTGTAMDAIAAAARAQSAKR